MSDAIAETVTLARLQEQLRQERETFDQRKIHDRRWFYLKLAMGWSAVVLLPAVAVICGWIIVNHRAFTQTTVNTATVALLVDIVGVLVSVWRVVMGTGPASLAPVTKAETPGNQPGPVP